MAEELFDIVFKGELVRGVELAEARKNVGQLFKIDGPKLDALFSGRTVVLKKSVTFEAANKYRVAIKKAGARVDVLPCGKPGESAASPGKAVFGEVQSVAQQPLAQPAAEAGALSLAPAGSDVLSPAERRPWVAVDIDTADLSVKPVGPLLEAHEQRRAPDLDLNLSELSVAPAEGNLVRYDELKRPAPLPIDVPDLSVAPAGERLEGLAKKAPPPPPDTSRLRVAEE